MVIDFAFAVFEGVTFVLSFGASSGSVSTGLKEAMDTIKKAMKDMGKSELKKQI